MERQRMGDRECCHGPGHTQAYEVHKEGRQTANGGVWQCRKGQTFQTGSDGKLREHSWRPHTGLDCYGHGFQVA